jgi:hypothetical protein
LQDGGRDVAHLPRSLLCGRRALLSSLSESALYSAKKSGLALSLGAVAAGVRNERQGAVSLANSTMAWKRCNRCCRAYRLARRSWPLRQSAGRCRLRRGQPRNAAFWLAATRAGALEPTSSQGLAQPNVAAGPTLTARQTCAPPSVGARRPIKLVNLRRRGSRRRGRGIRKDEGRRMNNTGAPMRCANRPR